MLAACGDTASFIRLYRRHLPAVHRFLLARTGHPQDAEDLTALVFERVFTSLPRYRPTGSFRGWLFTIAQRTLTDHYRRHGPATRLIAPLGETLRDPTADPEAVALAAEEAQLAHTLLASLPRVQQDVLGLRFLAGLPYDEIARIVGKRVPAVKMLAYRALAELRRRCDDGEA